MAQTAIFYSITDAPNKLNKTLGTPIKSINTINLTRPCSILNPTILISYDSSIAGANYCHLDAPFNSYYFVGDITLVEGGKMQVPLSIDPLFTCRKEIMEAPCTVTRSGHYERPTLIVDTKLPIAQGRVECYSENLAGEQFNTNNGISGAQDYLLTVMGTTTTPPNNQT